MSGNSSGNFTLFYQKVRESNGSDDKTRQIPNFRIFDFVEEIRQVKPDRRQWQSCDRNWHKPVIVLTKLCVVLDTITITGKSL